jgi:hypothetical protein
MTPAVRLRRLAHRLAGLAELLEQAQTAPAPPPAVEHAISRTEAEALLLAEMLDRREMQARPARPKRRF